MTFLEEEHPHHVRNPRTYLRGAIRKVCYCVLHSNMYNRLSARQLKHVAFSGVSVGSKVLCNCSLLFYHLKRLVISIGELTDLSHAILTVPPILNNAHVFSHHLLGWQNKGCSWVCIGSCAGD